MGFSSIPFIVILLLSCQSFGNGANGFFIENLERSNNNLEGFSVHYAYSTSGSDWEGYCLNGVKLDGSTLIISSGKENIYNLKDMKKSNSASCGDQKSLLQFNNKDLNSSDLLILNPIDKKVKKQAKFKIVSFDSISKYFDLFKKKGIKLKEALEIGDQHINFKVAYDLDLDGSPDLLIFTHAVDYTHTYLIGKKASKWVILNIEYPL